MKVQPDTVSPLAQSIHGLALSSGHRRMVLVEGAADWACQIAASWLTQVPVDRVLWVGDGACADVTCCTPGEANRWLGSERQLLIWNGRSGYAPDALAALAGTLVAGGVFLMLLPPLEDWSSTLSDTGDDLKASAQRFSHRLIQGLLADPAILRLRQAHPWPEVPVMEAPRTPAAGAFEPTSDQISAIDAVIHVARGHRRRPLVVTADRGRGKSSALGIAASRLLQEDRRRILVTAPHLSAVDSLFRHAAQDWPDARGEPGLLHTETAELRFVPPDVLLRERPTADLLLVDEAAALPTAILTGLLRAYARVVFSTTVHGYEGSGRGFVLRFQRVLETETPQWRGLLLSQPVRWAPGDPVEDWLTRTLLLDAEAAHQITVPEAELFVRSWPGPERDLDEGVLRQAYGLLVEAHYRTTPDDLRQLLDDDTLHLWLAQQGETVVGVLWVQEEGGLDPALGDAVAMGRRRLRGHLLPQSLANHGGDPTAIGLRYGRVVRVAVHPQCRRLGIGARLIAAAREQALAVGWDVLGTSFGADVALLAFWRASGLEVMRLGLHREASSGAYAVMLGEGLSMAGRRLVAMQQARFADHWPGLLATHWRWLDVGLVCALMAALPPGTGLVPEDQRELRYFGEGYRQFELSRLPLQRLSHYAMLKGIPPTWSEDDLALWVAAVLQQRNWADLRAEGVVDGRRQGEQRLRHLAVELFRTVTDLDRG